MSVSGTFFCPGVPDSTKPPGTALWADFHGLTPIQVAFAGILLQEPSGGSEVVARVVKAEMAANDFISTVKYSPLGASEGLIRSISEFITDSDEILEHLVDLNMKALSSLDA